MLISEEGNRMEKYNIYCDESCHLEHDKEKVMVIGGIKVETTSRKRICKEILEIKQRHGIKKYSEIKWNKVSKCNLDYFKDLIEYFFDCDDMKFRAIIVDKTKVRNDEFGQTYDEFYYKMYFHCLSGLVETKNENYIYVDKKDTKGTYKINNLKFYLAQEKHDFDQRKIKHIQCVNSNELPILQLADLLIGAVGYNNRDIKNPSQAKLELVDMIKEKSGYSLTRSTFLSESKFNLFFIDLQ